ncbi:putative ribonuclease H-like domain-containing protein, partial [Tanacetum coccineum]
ERISHKRTKNQSKRDKTGHGMEKCVETKPNQRADYANWETSFMKERKWEKENDKRKDMEGPFLDNVIIEELELDDVDDVSEVQNRAGQSRDLLQDSCRVVDSGKSPSISFMRPFGCPLTILNTLDSLGKFDGKSDEGYLIGYSTTSKAFSVYNKRTKRVEENLHIDFLEDQPNVAGTGPNWMKIDVQILFYPFGSFVVYSKDFTRVADFNNMDDTINVSPIPTLRIHKNHPKDQILGDHKSAVQTRGKIQKASSAQQVLVSYISKQNRTNHKDHQNCLLACFLSQEEPKNISQALQDESWVEAMQEELLQFKLQKVWILVDLPSGKKAIGTKIEAIRLFLAFASYMGFTVYQMDVKSVFLYGTIEEEVYVHQPSGFVNPAYPNKVYKVIKALYGLHQAPRAWYETLSSFLMENGFRRANILKKFDFCSIRTTTTPIESNKPLVKDEDGVDVDVHVYRSMIGSLMYLTTSRPDIMFAVCACARFQVTPKASHLNAVKRIFRYLKHQPKLGLWYLRDSPFELEAFLDSDYGGASLDRKSTTGGCQFLGRRLISWQCKKQTIVANSTTEAEYVAAANCCRQVLWIQSQMMNGIMV